MVGPGRVERPTSRLSGVRSNHLSYEPKRGVRHWVRRPHPLRGNIPRTFARDSTERKGNEGGGWPPVSEVRNRSEVGETLPVVCSLCSKPRDRGAFLRMCI